MRFYRDLPAYPVKAAQLANRFRYRRTRIPTPCAGYLFPGTSFSDSHAPVTVKAWQVRATLPGER